MFSNEEVDIAAADSAWPNMLTARRHLQALIDTLNTELLLNPSATLTLDHWCDRHLPAADGPVLADKIAGMRKPASDDTRRRLVAGADRPICHRRVHLRRGGDILSEADNWFLRDRLTPDMLRQLDESDMAFGRVVRPLNYTRRTLSTRQLWLPLAPGWENGGPFIDLPDHILEHHAVLLLPDGTPFSEVVETYRRDLFPPGLISPAV